MRIVPGASPVCSATSRMLSPSAIGPAIVTGTDDAPARAHPARRANRSQRCDPGPHRRSHRLHRRPLGARPAAPRACTSAAWRATRAAPKLPDARPRSSRATSSRSRRSRRRSTGVDVAYYLVHSMGARPRRRLRASATARAPAPSRGRRAPPACERVVYLGGLEGGELRAPAQPRGGRGDPGRRGTRHRPRARGDGHRRAAAPRSSSCATSSSACRRWSCPRWIDTRTQPIAIRDVVATLARARRPATTAPSEVQLGGADVLSYREMMHRYAAVAGRRAPLVVRVPVLTPRLSSYWLGLVTPVDTGVARPLVQGLSAEMLVRTAPPAGNQRRAAGLRRRRSGGPGRRRGVGSRRARRPRRCRGRAAGRRRRGPAQGVRPGAPGVAAHRA